MTLSCDIHIRECFSDAIRIISNKKKEQGTHPKMNPTTPGDVSTLYFYEVE